jgi:hypothetical protein
MASMSEQLADICDLGQLNTELIAMNLRRSSQDNKQIRGVTAHHTRESYIPKATRRRPNSGVLACEHERVGRVPNSRAAPSIAPPASVRCI